MRNHIFVFALILTLSGCVTLPQIRAKNRENLIKLSVGMTKDQVLTVMGTKTKNAYDEWGNLIEVINNPYKTETLKGAGKVFEVLYYYTEIKNQDGAISNDELTPLIFEEGKLVGWGWGFFEDTTKKYELTIKDR